MFHIRMYQHCVKLCQSRPNTILFQTVSVLASITRQHLGEMNMIRSCLIKATFLNSVTKRTACSGLSPFGCYQIRQCFHFLTQRDPMINPDPHCWEFVGSNYMSQPFHSFYRLSLIHFETGITYPTNLYPCLTLCSCSCRCLIRRKSKQALRDYKKVQIQLENLETSVRDRCKKEFTGKRMSKGRGNGAHMAVSLGRAVLSIKHISFEQAFSIGDNESPTFSVKPFCFHKWTLICLMVELWTNRFGQTELLPYVVCRMCHW